MSRPSHNHRFASWALLAGCTVVACGAGLLAAPSAQAQFVCDIVGGGSAMATATGGGSSMACGTLAHAAAVNSTAIGNNTDALGSGSTAIGSGAIAADTAAIGDANTAIGFSARAMAANTIALGANAQALHDNSIVIAVGDLFGLQSTRANQVLLGSFTSTYTLSGVATSQSRAAQGTVRGIVTTDGIGNLASDNGALQTQANSNTANIAANAANIATNTTNIITSAANIAANTTNIAINAANITANTTGIASIQANGTSFLATNMTGAAAAATGVNSFAAGANSVASGNRALAIGAGAQATGLGSIAIGQGAVATGSVAVGSASSAANGGAAYGDNAIATGTNASAVGNGAQATFANSAAFGAGAAATRGNQQVYGTASNTYTMPGIASSASRAAQSGPTQIVTSDAGGNLATASPAALGLASASDITAINSQLTSVNQRVSDLTRESRRGIAAAMALTTAPMPSAAGRTSWAANAATFLGEGAFGLSLAHRLNIPVSLALTAGYSYGGGNAHGARIGLQGEF